MNDDPRLWIALDGLDSVQMHRLCTDLFCELPPMAVRGVKLTDALADTGGMSIIRQMQQEFEFGMWPDLKLHDIPRTVANWARRIGVYAPVYVTVQTSGGSEMCRAAVEVLGPDVVLGVTLLTSIDVDLCRRIYHAEPADVVLKLAKIGISGGLRQFVCSPHEVHRLKSATYTDVGMPEGWTPKIVCAGISPRWAKTPSDQARSATPYEAIFNGADEIVVGEAIVSAVDPVKATESIIAEIGDALQENTPRSCS